MEEFDKMMFEGLDDNYIAQLLKIKIDIERMKNKECDQCKEN